MTTNGSQPSDADLSLRYGENHLLQIILIEPLFEEANRCRRLLARVMRGLDAHGIGSMLPCLPGTGESLTAIDVVRLSDWHAALAAVVATVEPTVVASLRGGALLDGGLSAKGWWRLSPETGARIVRDLRRTQQAGAGGDSALYAGHPLCAAFLADLEAAAPTPIAPLRTARLENDAGEADVRLVGSPLWRRAEPGDDAALAEAITADLAHWTKQCAAC